jgi:adenylate cyclase
MPYIQYMPESYIIPARPNETILHVSQYAGIPHVHVCGGFARCSTCRVLVLDGLEHCSPRSQAEKEVARQLRLPEYIRLGCQTHILGDLKIRLLVQDHEEDESIFMDQLLLGCIGEEKELAILFADIRGFTRFAENTPPYDVIYILNRYFGAMGKPIQRYGGSIFNYMGDGLMAVFGVQTSTWAAEQAVRAALEMLVALEQLNHQLPLLTEHPLHIGIGIHFGSVVMGGIGSSSAKQMTVIGDNVNFASRIETANKQVGSSLLVSEEVYAQVKDKVLLGRTPLLAVPGKTGEFPLYEVTAIDQNYAVTPPTPSFWQQCWWRIRLLWKALELTFLKRIRIRLK